MTAGRVRTITRGVPRTVGRPCRRAMTLVEALIAAALALVVIATLVTIFGRGTVISGQTTAQLSLSTDVRALVDDLVSDVHATLYLQEPASAADFARDGRIVLHRSAGSDPALRVERNAKEGPGYPYLSDRETTVQHLDVRRVVYERKPDPAGAPDASQVWREETGGFLTRTLQADGVFRYAFAPDARVKSPRPGRERRAGHLTRLEAAPLALTLDPATGARTLVPAGHALAPRQDQACLLLLSLTARWPGPEAPDGELRFATKIWISEKLLAFRFPEFFSSVDENLGY